MHILQSRRLLLDVDAKLAERFSPLWNYLLLKMRSISHHIGFEELTHKMSSSARPVVSCMIQAGSAHRTPGLFPYIELDRGFRIAEKPALPIDEITPTTVVYSLEGNATSYLSYFWVVAAAVPIKQSHHQRCCWFFRQILYPAASTPSGGALPS